MRKRFTDADKWKKMWFRSLSGEHKNLWFYLTDECGFDGVLEIDPKAIEFYTGFTGDIPDIIKEKMGFQAIDSDQVLCVKWLRFQYKELREHVATHKRIISRLREKGLDQHFPELQENF